MEIKLFGKHEFRRHIVEKLESISVIVFDTREKVVKLMTTTEDLLAAMADVELETTRIADALVLLQAEKEAAVSPDDAAIVQGKIDAHLERLRGMAKDPMHPVPPEDTPTV